MVNQFHLISVHIMKWLFPICKIELANFTTLIYCEHAKVSLERLKDWWLQWTETVVNAFVIITMLCQELHYVTA